MDFTEDSVWKQSFFTENFNVDKCLSKYTLKTDLETLRKDLRVYGSELHNQMADILKVETEAIVNLAEYLTSLSSKIENLSIPISQLREEIRTLYDLIKNAQDTYIENLENIKANSLQQNALHLNCNLLLTTLYVSSVMNGGDSELDNNAVVLERVVNKFSFECYYLQAAGISNNIKEVVDVEEKLTELLNDTFVSAMNDKKSDVILRCLRMYDNLGKHQEAEQIYQKCVVNPKIKHLFTETYLESCNQDVNKIYLEALQFLDDDALVLDILEKNNTLNGYNFVMNSFWKNVDKQLREGLPLLTAPGNPEIFQKRFISTWNFLAAIAKKCGDKELIFSNNSFQAHLKRFNLPVYFEIRFQQITGCFEKDAVMTVCSSDIYLQPDLSSDFKLKLTLSLWKALEQCFSPEVFIDNLSDQFLKLSMLMLSRYLKWFDDTLSEPEPIKELEMCENFIVYSLCDLRTMKNLIGSKLIDVEQTMFRILPYKVKPYLETVFELNSKMIAQVESKLQTHLITTTCNESLLHLQNVAAIPRLYRRTNKNAPKDASHYITEAIEPILKFHKKFETNEDCNVALVFNKIVADITKTYLTLVQDVLRSVFKTEESLRRLKNRNINSGEDISGQTSENTISDEMKIREQIRLDVYSFVDKLVPLVSDGDARKSLYQLKSNSG